MACSDYADEGSCSSWDPAANISYSSGVYYVDEDWISSTIRNLAPLWTCDDAYLDDAAGSTVGWKVYNASSGEALYELGLRNGDKIYKVNGVTMNDVEDGFDLLDEYLNGETEYDLQIKRGFSTVHLYYEVD